MNNWDKTKRPHTHAAISAHPKGYISILNAIETLTRNADNSLLGVGEKKHYSFSLPADPNSVQCKHMPNLTAFMDVGINSCKDLKEGGKLKKLYDYEDGRGSVNCCVCEADADGLRSSSFFWVVTHVSL